MGNMTPRAAILVAAITACTLFLTSAAAWAQPTAVPTATATRTPGIVGSPTNTPLPHPQDDDDANACHIHTIDHRSGKAWMILIPIAGLIVLRRRYR